MLFQKLIPRLGRSAEVTKQLLRETPKDTIPPNTTGPRRQRSSRVYPLQRKTDLEKSPNFHGLIYFFTERISLSDMYSFFFFFMQKSRRQGDKNYSSKN